MRLVVLIPLLIAATGPAAAQSPEWRIDREDGERLTLRATLSAEACPDWAQGLALYGEGRVTTDRMVGAERLVRIAYEEAGVEAECLGGLALLSGPADRLRGLVAE